MGDDDGQAGQEQEGECSGLGKLPQDVLQNTAIRVIRTFGRGVDANRRPETDGRTILLARHHRSLCRAGQAGAEVDRGNIEHLGAVQTEGISVLAFFKLKRKDSHADKVRAMNALEALSDHRAHAQKSRAF